MFFHCTIIDIQQQPEMFFIIESSILKLVFYKITKLFLFKDFNLKISAPVGLLF